MGWSYNRLWILLINKNMKRGDLRQKAGISNAAMAKMGKNLPITMNVLGNICDTLHCRLEDIVEYVPEPAETQNNDN
ncbi:MAG: helix-turn-helix transcriptional regulator [Oscillospiraceae bacterium]|nr:helix-turn-helix transcriptional regulator [Oscillospiraceae bacterium]